jgi:CheY-like chemotaxis protein
MTPQSSLAAFPTILLLESDSTLRVALARVLRGHGYLVLEAHDVPKAFELVRMHSRLIHLLLMGMSFDDAVAATLKTYRPNMHVLRVTGDQTHPTGAGVATLESAPDMVRQFFATPKSDADQNQDD